MRVALRAVAAICCFYMWGCYHPNAATGVPCAANGDCPEGQSCDTTQSPPTCVKTSGPGTPDAWLDAPPDAPPACLDDSMCTASAPICDPTSHTCRGCAADAECMDGVCVEYTGKCVADADALFLAPGGLDLGACTRAAPCATFNYAFTQVTPTLATIRVGDGAYTETVHLMQTQMVTGVQVVISGERRAPAAATITATAGSVLLLDSNTSVLLEGVTLQNGPNVGIDSRGTLLASHVAVVGNAADGIAHSGTSLKVFDSAVLANGGAGVTPKGGIDLERDLIRENQGGGLHTSQGPLTVVNCIIAKNGSTGSNLGGVRMDNATLIGTHLEFDTIAYNQVSSASGEAPGLASNSPVAATNLILADNGASGSLQMSAVVAVTHSLFEGGPAPQGMGNKSGSPAFKDITNGDFHITASSVAIDNAATSTIDVDIDGESRPYGAGPDMGADEYHP